jgi:hypothetical protein
VPSLERLLLSSLVLLGVGLALELMLGLQQFAFIAPHQAPTERLLESNGRRAAASLRAGGGPQPYGIR